MRRCTLNVKRRLARNVVGADPPAQAAALEAADAACAPPAAAGATATRGRPRCPPRAAPPRHRVFRRRRFCRCRRRYQRRWRQRRRVPRPGRPGTRQRRWRPAAAAAAPARSWAGGCCCGGAWALQRQGNTVSMEAGASCFRSKDPSKFAQTQNLFMQHDGQRGGRSPETGSALLAMAVHNTPTNRLRDDCGTDHTIADTMTAFVNSCRASPRGRC